MRSPSVLKDDPSMVNMCPICERDDFASESGMKIHHAKAHGESLRPKKECVICSTEFHVSPNHVDETKCCSQNCRAEYMSEIMSNQTTITCDVCGEEFDRDPSRVGERNFCTQKCYGEWRSEVVVGAENPQYKGGPVEKVCEVCGVTFHVKQAHSNQRFCDINCAAEWRSENLVGEDSPAWKGGYTPYYGPNWPEKRADARERDDYTCQSCGQVEPEQPKREFPVHHIIPRRDYIDQEGNLDYNGANQLENLITFCHGCHAKWEGIPLRPQTLG